MLVHDITITATLPLEPGRTLTTAESDALREASLTTALNQVVAYTPNDFWRGPPRTLYGGPNYVTLDRVREYPDGVDTDSFAVANLMAEVRRALPGFAGWRIANRVSTPADLATTSPTGGRILIMMHTAESSVLQSSAPEAHNIQAGFEKYTRFTNPERGHWVGVAPRIVRQGSLTGANLTHAAWLYEFPDTQWVRDHLSTLVSDVQRGVQTGLLEETARANPVGIPLSANWNQVTSTEYNPVLNGSYEFWRCPPGTPPAQCAAVTRSTVQFPNVTSTEYVENPIGPDSALTHPGGSQDLWNDVKSFFTSPKFGWSIVIVGGIAALVYLTPIAATWTAARRRKNPNRNSSVDYWYAR